MRKKSQDELGTLVTREMKVMLQDEGLTKEQRFDVLAAVMFDAPVKNALLASFAKSLKAGFALINVSRYRAIEREREWRKNHERKRRNGGYLDENGSTSNSMSLHTTPCNSMSLHDGLKQNKTKQGISPYKPPKGGEREPGKVRPEDLVGKPGKKNVWLCRFMDARGICTNEDIPRCGLGCIGQTCSAYEEIAVKCVRVATVKELTETLAQDIEQTEAFGRMRVNRRNLMRHLLPIVKKNCAAEGEDERTSNETRSAFWKLHKTILDGLDAWTAAWKADDWQYAPGKITKWLADEKYLQPPRKKTAAPESVGSGCGDCGPEIA